MNHLYYDVVVIGSGAAGYNAANRIKEMSNLSLAIVTEEKNTGTSRNTGSDKQTYYKLGLGGNAPDSVQKMSEDLFAGGSADGDNALCEAALSARCFMNLCELGVPFPTNRYGEYIGYKTDHDPFARAASAGPLTSRFMTEALERHSEMLGVEVLNGYLAIEILTNKNSVLGLICLKTETGDILCIRTGNIILATGGPAGIYADSVYPKGHTGASSLALTAGAKAQNLTEWQYGLASVNPRWNVSGTYMQVLPRFVSVDSNGTEHEFLADYYKDINEALSAVFLKGYQWPFDSKKVKPGGSSVIDLLVYRECVLKKRRVYLDFTKNPFGLAEIDFKALSSEVYQYLQKSDALFGTPIDRLFKMNAPAIDLYKQKGLDITSKYLEIALCAQHHNGGIAVDAWWQTGVHGLFAVGECAGTHGIVRPGGSALNAGQVGSLRAAQYICRKPNQADVTAFLHALSDALEKHSEIRQTVLKQTDNADEKIAEARRRMSDGASAIRTMENIKVVLQKVEAELKSPEKHISVSSPASLCKFYKYRDMLITQQAVLYALADYINTVGKTRGSALYYDKNGVLCDGLEEQFRFRLDDGQSAQNIQETEQKGGIFVCRWRSVRPIPERNEIFETVWRNFRENGNIY